MQRITIKNENGAILAILHAENTIIKETNGISVTIDGDTPSPTTGPAGRQIIHTLTDEWFQTADGYTLRPEGKFWTDGDLSFAADREGHPIDCNGHRLKGHYVDWCPICHATGHKADNCHYKHIQS